MSSATALERALGDFRRLELLAAGDSAIHRLDARAKLLATAAFLVAVISFDRYALAALLPFAAFPLWLTLAAGLPAALVLRRSALVLPFALAVGALNPLFDPAPLFELAGHPVSGGVVSWASIVLRALLAASAAVVLVATTGFAAIAAALGRLGLPRALVVQLALLYRYLQLLGEEAGRLLRARELRAAGAPLRLAEFGPLAGQLLLRSWDRADRIYLAMRARGFDGRYRPAAPGRWSWRDSAFVAAWLVAFVALRGGGSEALGAALLGAAP
jgi:cobalt/nickel transport system permease protein